MSGSIPDIYIQYELIGHNSGVINEENGVFSNSLSLAETDSLSTIPANYNIDNCVSDVNSVRKLVSDNLILDKTMWDTYGKVMQEVDSNMVGTK
ncbi:MAG: hypothetical protein J5625_06775 [Lachnospiraceae bacterium]|nr:hypothetical protein [Lachnospiraceae bacterium]